MTILERYFTYMSSKKEGQKHPHRYVNKLQDFVKLYNNTINSRTRLPPNAVNKSNEYEVWERLFGKYIDELSKPRPAPLYKVGDYIRISRQKMLFEKGEAMLATAVIL